MLLAAACGARSELVGPLDAAASDAPRVDATRVDAGAGEDVPPGGCVRAAQCTAPPASTLFFSTAWSCIDRRCVWEVNGGRTCVRAADGCFECDREPRRTCPGQPCAAPLARDATRLERAFCARDFFAGVRGCFGGFVTLDDQVCTVADAPTGAIRYVLACGPCETVYAPR